MCKWVALKTAAVDCVESKDIGARRCSRRKTYPECVLTVPGDWIGISWQSTRSAIIVHCVGITVRGVSIWFCDVEIGSCYIGGSEWIMYECLKDSVGADREGIGSGDAVDDGRLIL